MLSPATPHPTPPPAPPPSTPPTHLRHAAQPSHPTPHLHNAPCSSSLPNHPHTHPRTRNTGPALHAAEHQDGRLPRELQLLQPEQPLVQGHGHEGGEAHGPGGGVRGEEARRSGRWRYTGQVAGVGVVVGKPMDMAEVCKVMEGVFAGAGGGVEGCGQTDHVGVLVLGGGGHPPLVGVSLQLAGTPTPALSPSPPPRPG